MRIEIIVKLGEERSMYPTTWNVSVDNNDTFRRNYEGTAGHPKQDEKIESIEKAIRDACEIAITAVKLEKYAK